MTNLKKLDLSFNSLTRIHNFESLKELRELNLAFNKIENIDNLSKNTNLKILILDNNRIRRLENLRSLRKLESLSINGNLLEDLSLFMTNEPMIELKQLSVNTNSIKTLKQINFFPNVISSSF